MRSKAARQAAAINDVIERIPGALETIANFARHVDTLADRYRGMHWGHSGRKAAAMLSIPDGKDGVIEMGSLVQLNYLTRKGRGRPIEEFYHRFDSPHPVLGVAANGSGLIVVRDSSSYTITNHGIEG